MRTDGHAQVGKWWPGPTGRAGPPFTTSGQVLLDRPGFIHNHNGTATGALKNTLDFSLLLDATVHNIIGSCSDFKPWSIPSVRDVLRLKCSRHLGIKNFFQGYYIPKSIVGGARTRDADVATL